MKILYLRLKNSAGIYAGTGRREITIDFNKSNNNMIMLFGGNGSGKSTILSSLNPFNSTTNDERSQFYIKDTDGEKEIHYKLDKDVYIIKHFTSDKNKTKSYITKISYKTYLEKLKTMDPINIYKYGEELNDNGGVITFKEFIKNKFGIDEEFFKISRIGSNVTNFIDLSTANRKKYISTFLPNIDSYLSAYNTVSDKFKILKKEIDFISDEILKIDDKDTLSNKIKETKVLLEEVNSNYEETLKRETDLKTKIRMLDEDGDLEAHQFKNYYKLAYESFKSVFEKSVNESTDEETTEEYFNELTNEFKIINDKLNKLNLECIERERSLNEVQDLIDKKESQIKNSDRIDVDELNELIESKNNEINEYENEINELNISDSDFTNEFIHYSDNLFDKINIIKKYDDIINKIKNFFSSLNIDELEKLTTFNDKNSYDKFINELMIKENNLSNTRNNFMELKVLYNSQESNLDKLEILNKRPESCKTDNCPFIKDALKYKNLKEEINDTKQQLISAKEVIDNLSKEIEYYKSIKSKMEQLINSLSWNDNIINEYFTLFENNISYNSSDKYAFIDYIYKKYNNNDFKKQCELDKYIIKEKNISYINDIKNDLTRLNEKIGYSKTVNDILDNLNKELNELNTRKEDIVKEYTSVINQQKETKVKETELQDKINKYDNYKENKIQYEKYKTLYEAVQNKLDRINEYKQNYIYANSEKKRLKEEVDRLTNDVNKLNSELIRLENYTDRKKNLEDNFTNVSLIKEALNPTKGIPVYFIQNYLDKTKLITNKLLDISQKGKMAINFEISDKDFFIKVYKNNGDILEDIKEASQGEVALVTLSLSLALIEQSTSKYNIFLLDELDGALDYKNRRSFLDMIETQMKSLNSEQVFIISHNQEFENYPIDMILLSGNNINTKDKEFMSNKNVLFSL